MTLTPSGTVSLGCGIESALTDRGIDGLLDHEHLILVCDFISGQLAERPWAELTCPQGSARIQLMPMERRLGTTSPLSKTIWVNPQQIHGQR